MSAVKRGLPLMLEATFSEVYEASLQIPGFGQGQTKEAGLTPDWETDDGQHVKVNFWVHQHDEPVRDYVYERYGLAAKCVFGAKVAMKQPIEAWPPEAYAARRDILGSEMPLLPMTAGEDTELSVTRALELALDPNHGVSWWEYTRYTLIDAADDEVLDEQYVPLNEFDAMSPPTEDTGAMTPAERRQFKQLESRLSKSTDAPQDALIRVRLRQWLAVSDLVQYSELFEHNQFFVPLDRAFDK